MNPPSQKQIRQITQNTKENQTEPAPPGNYQMARRNERLEYITRQAKKTKPANIRELAALIETTYPGISTPTRNTYARTINRILRLPYTADFPEL